jgi:hypothetical protein
MSLILSGTDGLSEVDGSAATPAIRGTDANTGIFFGTDIIGFSEGGAEVARFDSSGNFGIGTASPSNKLDVFRSTFGGSNTSLILSSVNSASAKINFAGLGYEVSQGTAGSEAGAMYFSTYGSGALTERMRIDSSGNLLFNSGYGSVATAYGCRAWVNFNGTGTPAIRASGNVSSITDNGTGDYTINFSTAMPDANYSVSALSRITSTGIAPVVVNLLTTTTPTASLFRICTDRNGIGVTDPEYVFASVFR